MAGGIHEGPSLDAAHLRTGLLGDEVSPPLERVYLSGIWPDSSE